MMTFSCLVRQEGKLYPENNQILNSTIDFEEKNVSEFIVNQTYISLDSTEAKIQISMALTFTVGLFQVVFLIKINLL